MNADTGKKEYHAENHLLVPFNRDHMASSLPSALQLKYSVKNVYKQLLWRARDYPDGGIEKARPRIYSAFLKNVHETDPQRIYSGIKRAEFVLKELEALIYLKKYRTLRRRYSKEAEDDPILPPSE